MAFVCGILKDIVIIKTGEDGRVANERIIGDKLKQARTAKDISLEELQKRTKIQKRYLEALETGDFTQLPGDYYVRSFIREYAAVVEEDGDLLVAMFNGESVKEEEEVYIPTSRAALHEEVVRKTTWTNYIPVILLGLVALTIISIIAFMTWQERNAPPMIQNTASSTTTQQQTSQAQQQTEQTKKEEKPASSQTKDSKETKNSAEKKSGMKIKRTFSSPAQATLELSKAEDPVELTFKGKDEQCWIGVLVDNIYIYQYTLKAKEEQKILLPEGVKEALVTLGSSEQVTVKANGEQLDFKDPDYDAVQKNLVLLISYED